MEGHVKLLAFIYIAYHALGVLLALLVFGILSGVGLLSGEWEAAGILTVTSACSRASGRRRAFSRSLAL